MSQICIWKFIVAKIMGQAQINVRTRACSRTSIARTRQAALTHNVRGKELKRQWRKINLSLCNCNVGPYTFVTLIREPTLTRYVTRHEWQATNTVYSKIDNFSSSQSISSGHRCPDVSAKSMPVLWVCQSAAIVPNVSMSFPHLCLTFPLLL